MDYTMLKLPPQATVAVDVHKKWMQTLKEANDLAADDNDLQRKAKGGMFIKERKITAEVMGRLYAQYCQLVNKMYDAFLNTTQVQRRSYIQELIKVFMKRVYELRSELVHIIVNDYIYIDAALTQMKMIPENWEVVVPYHFAVEFRPDTIETLLRKMWADAVKRKLSPPQPKKAEKPAAAHGLDMDEDNDFPTFEPDEPSQDTIVESVKSVTIIPEEYIQSLVIQRHERFRRCYVKLRNAENAKRKLLANRKATVAPKNMRIRAAQIIQLTFRAYMKLKRKHVLDIKRDVLLGLIPDTRRISRSFREENNKIYQKRIDKRKKIVETFMKDLEREKVRLYFLGRDQEQMEDISVQIREWFMEWYYGYGFFPQYPYDVEGGTILVIRGDYTTIEEKIIADEKYKTATKGKTAEQLKQEKEQAAADKQMKDEAEADRKKKEAENLFKMRCNPMADPGYQPKATEINVLQAIRSYYASWDHYDILPPDEFKDVVYGYMKPLLTEDLMKDIHRECRLFVDEFMRLELKLFVQAQQAMYKRVGWKYPKMKPKARPKPPAASKTFVFDETVEAAIEGVFDIEVISKPTTKLVDVYGDCNYVAADYNVRDPDVSYPTPGYGDVKRRLVLSCIHGMGFAEGPKKNRAVLLVGPPSNGKSFLVDAICGEINAVKIDITPEVFNAKLKKPSKLIPKVFLAAKSFQPAIVFLKNIERVFCKKVQPKDKKLKIPSIKKMLIKQVRAITTDDKVLFLATCSYPLLAKARPMAGLFSEIILVPMPDYGTLRQFLYNKLQSIGSMSRDYCAQPIARTLQGFGLGACMKLYDTILTSERIVRLNVTPLSPFEFLEHLLENEMEPMPSADYLKYEEWFIKNSYLRKEREEYTIINEKRAYAYEKLTKKEEEE